MADVDAGMIGPGDGLVSSAFCIEGRSSIDCNKLVCGDNMGGPCTSKDFVFSLQSEQ